MREAKLNELLAEELRARSRRDRGCPPGDALVAAAAGELADATREEVVDHVARCPDCAVEYSLASELRTLANQAAQSARPAAPAPWRGVVQVRRWLPLAAAIAFVAIGIAVFEARRDAPGAREVRGTTAASEWRVSPADEARLRSRPDRLDWPEVPGIGRYRVVLYDAESRPLWESGEVAASAVELPAELALHPGQTYYWRVLARRELIETRSPLFSFRLEP